MSQYFVARKDATWGSEEGEVVRVSFFVAGTEIRRIKEEREHRGEKDPSLLLGREVPPSSSHLLREGGGLWVYENNWSIASRLERSILRGGAAREGVGGPARVEARLREGSRRRVRLEQRRRALEQRCGLVQRGGRRGGAAHLLDGAARGGREPLAGGRIRLPAGCRHGSHPLPSAARALLQSRSA